MTEEIDRLLTIQEVVQMVGLSRASIYAMVKRDKFPGPYRAGTRAARWKSSDVQRWIDLLPPAAEGNWK